MRGLSDSHREKVCLPIQTGTNIKINDATSHDISIKAKSPAI
jgi:hypothetical protein